MTCLKGGFILWYKLLNDMTPVQPHWKFLRHKTQMGSYKCLIISLFFEGNNVIMICSIL